MAWSSTPTTTSFSQIIHSSLLPLHTSYSEITFAFNAPDRSGAAAPFPPHNRTSGFPRIRLKHFVRPFLQDPVIILHACSKQLIKLLQYLLKFDPAKMLQQFQHNRKRTISARPGFICPRYGAKMKIISTMLRHHKPRQLQAAQ